MKIKQHGTIPNWELDVTCKNCNAIITLEGADDMYAKSHLTGKTEEITSKILSKFIAIYKKYDIL